MQIKSKKCFRFSNATIGLAEDGKTRVHSEKEFVVIQPSTEIQDAPDWIKNDPLFDAAVDSGDLEEVIRVSKKKETAKTAEPENTKKAGWGEFKPGLQA